MKMKNVHVPVTIRSLKGKQECFLGFPRWSSCKTPKTSKMSPGRTKCLRAHSTASTLPLLLFASTATITASLDIVIIPLASCCNSACGWRSQTRLLVALWMLYSFLGTFLSWYRHEQGRECSYYPRVAIEGYELFAVLFVWDDDNILFLLLSGCIVFEFLWLK